MMWSWVLPRNPRFFLLCFVFFFSFRYGGPCSQSVRSVFAISWISYLASKEGIVIALVDGRGTAFQGDRLLYAVYRKLGVYEVEDQITAVRWALLIQTEIGVQQKSCNHCWVSPSLMISFFLSILLTSSKVTINLKEIFCPNMRKELPMEKS